MKKEVIKKICGAVAAAMIFTAMPMTTLNAQKVSAYECSVIQNGGFNHATLKPWELDVVSPAKAEGVLENGAYKITVDNIIDNSKDSRWGVELVQKRVNLRAGHTYNVSFTVTADHDCMVYPVVGDDGGEYYEYWNGGGTVANGGRTWTPVSLKAGETKTVKGSFKVDKNINKCCIKFQLTGDCAPKDLLPGEKYSYTFSNVSLTTDLWSF